MHGPVFDTKKLLWESSWQVIIWPLTWRQNSNNMRKVEFIFFRFISFEGMHSGKSTFREESSLSFWRYLFKYQQLTKGHLKRRNYFSLSPLFSRNPLLCQPPLLSLFSRFSTTEFRKKTENDIGMRFAVRKNIARKLFASDKTKLLLWLQIGVPKTFLVGHLREHEVQKNTMWQKRKRIVKTCAYQAIRNFFWVGALKLTRDGTRVSPKGSC